MNNPDELRKLLSYFNGTLNWHFNPLYLDMFYTDGVQAFVENAGGGAYWFLDIIGTEVFTHQISEEFIHIVLLSEDGWADIMADDGDNNSLWTRHIEYTDCPVGKWEFYLTNNILLLPSEY